jgi:hypothetical protein
MDESHRGSVKAVAQTFRTLQDAKSKETMHQMQQQWPNGANSTPVILLSPELQQHE